MKLIYVMLFAACLSLHAQQTIFLKKGHDTMILFPSDIEGDIHLGNDLEFDAIKISDRVLKLNIINELKIKPVSGTTCSVFSAGKLYNFDIRLSKYDKEKGIIHADPKLAHDILSEKEENTPASKIEKVDNHKRDNEYLRVVSNCKNNKKRKRKIYSTFEKSYNMMFSLIDIAHQNDKMYLFLDVKNKGLQNYDVEWIHLFVTTKQLGQKGAYKNTIFPSYYIHNAPETIKGKTDYSFIVVFDKTAIDQYENINIDIKELKGERNLILNIKDEIINNPNRL